MRKLKCIGFTATVDDIIDHTEIAIKGWFFDPIETESIRIILHRAIRFKGSLSVALHFILQVICS